jgi:predicted DNA-binding transcriptional regulator AlpA
MARADERDPMLTEQQVAEMLQVSVRTLQRWRATGTGPPWTRVHRLVRYRRSGVERWVAEGDQPGGRPS